MASHWTKTLPVPHVKKPSWDPPVILGERRREMRGTIVGAWLHWATRFASRRALRSRRRQEERDRIHLESKEAQSTGPINWAEVSTELDAALDCLPRRDREAIVLRYFERLDFRSIGADLGVTEDAAQKRVGRALE